VKNDCRLSASLMIDCMNISSRLWNRDELHAKLLSALGKKIETQLKLNRNWGSVHVERS
jgi:hypothetical protein